MGQKLMKTGQIQGTTGQRTLGQPRARTPFSEGMSQMSHGTHWVGHGTYRWDRDIAPLKLRNIPIPLGRSLFTGEQSSARGVA